MLGARYGVATGLTCGDEFLCNLPSTPEHCRKSPSRGTSRRLILSVCVCARVGCVWVRRSHSLHNSSGTELCAIVESMFSYNEMFSIHGDVTFAVRIRTCRRPACIFPNVNASRDNSDILRSCRRPAHLFVNSAAVSTFSPTAASGGTLAGPSGADCVQCAAWGMGQQSRRRYVESSRLLGCQSGSLVSALLWHSAL